MPLADREVVALGLRPGAWVIDTRNIIGETAALLTGATPDLLARIRAALLREHLARRAESVTEDPCP